MVGAHHCRVFEGALRTPPCAGRMSRRSLVAHGCSAADVIGNFKYQSKPCLAQCGSRRSGSEEKGNKYYQKRGMQSLYIIMCIYTIYVCTLFVLCVIGLSSRTIDRPFLGL